VWGAVAKLDLDYNHVYDAMYKNGVPLSKQRICQPFGMAQKAGLDQFRVIEPETWERMLQRVEGVNFGAIYCRTSLFGNITSMKPDHLTWQQYTIFLLESLGLYEPKIMARYYKKIKYYMLWCQKNIGIPYGVLPETAERNNPCWRRMAKAIERNDFYLSYLEFGPDKAGDQLLIELRHKHQMALIGDGYIQPRIKKRLINLESHITVTRQNDVSNVKK
jgi:predicted phosphoadenosine phosphosulfate sulfurtransferase